MCMFAGRIPIEQRLLSLALSNIAHDTGEIIFIVSYEHT